MSNLADNNDSVKRALRNLVYALDQENSDFRKRCAHLERENTKHTVPPPSHPKVDLDKSLSDAKRKAEDAEYKFNRVVEELGAERTVKHNLTKSLAVAVDEKAKLSAELREVKSQLEQRGRVQDEDSKLWDSVRDALGGSDLERLDCNSLRVRRERDAAQSSLASISAENSGLKLRIAELEKVAKPEANAEFGFRKQVVISAARAVVEAWNTTLDANTEEFSLTINHLNNSLSRLAQS